MFFVNLFNAWINTTRGFSPIILCSNCCTLPHHVASRKLHCTVLTKWDWKGPITFWYYYEKSFDLVAPLKVWTHLCPGTYLEHLCLRQNNFGPFLGLPFLSITTVTLNIMLIPLAYFLLKFLPNCSLLYKLSPNKCWPLLFPSSYLREHFGELLCPSPPSLLLPFSFQNLPTLPALYTIKFSSIWILCHCYK